MSGAIFPDHLTGGIQLASYSLSGVSGIVYKYIDLEEPATDLRFWWLGGFLGTLWNARVKGMAN